MCFPLNYALLMAWALRHTYIVEHAHALSALICMYFLAVFMVAAHHIPSCRFLQVSPATCIYKRVGCTQLRKNYVPFAHVLLDPPSDLMKLDQYKSLHLLSVGRA